MNLDRKQFETEVAGQKVIFEVSKIGEQASAAVLGKYGETVVLATVVMDKKDREANYMPLTVDYEEKFYAAGKILGSRFVRREGKPSEEGILSARLIDRTIRPLFDQRIRRGIQVIATVLSYDEENDPDFIALMSASLALAISDVPWNGPVGGVRIALSKDGKIILNPTNLQMVDARFKTIVSGPKGKINMIELEGGQIQEKEVIEAFKLATSEIDKLVDFQNEIVKQIGKNKTVVPLAEPEAELKTEVQKYLSDKLEAVVYVKEKTDRQSNLFDLTKELKDYLTEKGFANLTLVDNLIDEAIENLVRKNVLESERRPDLRKLDELRPLYAEVSLLKRLHGSAIFVRGNTQSLAVTTLAAPGSEQLIETMETSTKRRFLLHYNFPPFSVGETGPLRGPGRRDIGHGALAEKAVRNLLPSQDEFPYTIRVVSEILSSNGSSSMATVCATSLSLMDAGVPIKNPAAGIAMGLVTDGKNHKVLTDIQGPEDHFGDMDCKVAGTQEGITAMQMDTKVEGLGIDVLEKVLIQAKKARLEILDVITKTLDKPRAEISTYAPTVLAHTILPEQIRDVIGPGGRVINGIMESTGATTIDVEQTGKVFVAASSKEKAEAAMNQIKGITHKYQIGEIIDGEVIKILDFGAIVGFNGKDGLLHISEMKDGFVKKTEDVVKLGDKLRVKIIKVDDDGRLGLTLKNVE
ncbi:MAG: polyribonucleotide nucleotidyltransferase [Candidatus Paceibacterota bacterium]|jgi:polyribonucleotide nucleotidyltransferase